MAIFARGVITPGHLSVTSNRDSSLATQRSVHSGELSASGVMWIRRSLLPITVTLLQTESRCPVQLPGRHSPSAATRRFISPKFVGVNSILPLGQEG
jgi:hypothetical protein